MLRVAASAREDAGDPARGSRHAPRSVPSTAASLRAGRRACRSGRFAGPSAGRGRCVLPADGRSCPAPGAGCAASAAVRWHPSRAARCPAATPALPRQPRAPPPPAPAAPPSAGEYPGRMAAGSCFPRHEVRQLHVLLAVVQEALAARLRILLIHGNDFEDALELCIVGWRQLRQVNEDIVV